MKQWEQIRRAYYVEEKSIREIARETGHARRTIGCHLTPYIMELPQFVDVVGELSKVYWS